MKICVISHAYVEQHGYLPVLTSMAGQPGVELALITPNAYRSSRLPLPLFEAALPSFRTFSVGIRLAERQGAFFYRNAEIERALDAFQPDVLLHEQEVYALGAGQIAAIATRRKLPMAMFVWENLPRKLALPRRMLTRYVVRRCAGLLVGSAAAARVHQGWGFRGPLEVVPQMGVSSIAAKPVLGRRDAACLRIAYAGRLIATKGLDCLLRAVALLRSEQVAVHCTLAGDGPERPSLEALSRSLGLEGSVAFAGTIPYGQVTLLLQASDILVLPSRRSPVWEEQFGRILVEAMAQATVTVGSRTGAIPEVIGSDHLLFHENDHEALAHVLARLAKDPVLFAQSQIALWQRVHHHYANDVLARQRVAFLRSLCGQ